MIAESSYSKTKINFPKKKIDPKLIYEILNGKAVYYRGYKNVIDGTKTIEEIMGSSGLQALIIEYFLLYVLRSINLREYRLLTNEIGLHLNSNNNLAGDLAIFEKTKLPIAALDKHYLTIPPKIQIEVDINADVEQFETIDNYIYLKTDNLLNFGVEKVIWVLTNSKKVIVATKTKNWEIINWDKTIELIDGIEFNVGQYLKEEGSPFA